METWQIRLLELGVPLSIWFMLNESKELADKIKKQNIHIPKYEWFKKQNTENKLLGVHVKTPLHPRADHIGILPLRYIVRLSQMLK
jgi:hypothetical protein